MWSNIKIFCRWFRKVMKMNIAFGWFWPLLKFFLFEWRFTDWPWNVVILLGFQVPVPYFDLIFGINLRHLYMWNNMNNYFRLIIGICVFSRETLRVVFSAAYSARMTMVFHIIGQCLLFLVLACFYNKLDWNCMLETRYKNYNVNFKKNSILLM